MHMWDFFIIKTWQHVFVKIWQNYYQTWTSAFYGPWCRLNSLPLKAGTHCPYIRVHFLTPVCTGRTYG